MIGRVLLHHMEKCALCQHKAAPYNYIQLSILLVVMKSIFILRFLGAAEGCLQLVHILKAKHIITEDIGRTT